MAVRLRINTLTPNTYRFADRSADYGGYLWLGRIQNAPQLEELASPPGTEFQVKRINVSLGNSDGIIPVTENLWGGVATLEIDNGTTTRTWSGIVKAYDHDGAGNLAIGVTEDPQHELSRMIPDEVVRLSTWSEAGADAVNTPVPTVLGGSAADPVRVPGILVDRTAFTFLLCVGEIRQVVKVFKDRVEVTEGFTAYVGAADQETFPGFAIVTFAADPRDDSGRWPEIHADVVGLKLGDHTEEECRNPARCLKYLFETAASGVGGWGLGVNALKIDGDSFDQAILDCQEIGFKLDGALSAQMTARQWISQMTMAMRGNITFYSGKYALRVDKAYVPPEPEEPSAGYITDTGLTFIPFTLSGTTLPVVNGIHNRIWHELDYSQYADGGTVKVEWERLAGYSLSMEIWDSSKTTKLATAYDQFGAGVMEHAFSGQGTKFYFAIEGGWVYPGTTTDYRLYSEGLPKVGSTTQDTPADPSRVTIGEHTYEFFEITSNRILRAESDIDDADILLVAGGGDGGGNGNGNGGGGGGAGGVLIRTGVQICAGEYPIIIGEGGGHSGNGGDSFFGEFKCGGGGKGGNYGSGPSAGRPGWSVGGCGGGAPRDSSQLGGAVGSQAGDGEETFNNVGGSGGMSSWMSGGGGGGAGGAGNAGGPDMSGISAPTSQGGAGISSDITGETLWYAGGGGGSFYIGPALGGSGVGGDGAVYHGTGSSATPNTGSGGGGGNVAGEGSGGIFIVRYKVVP